MARTKLVVGAALIALMAFAAVSGLQIMWNQEQMKMNDILTADIERLNGRVGTLEARNLVCRNITIVDDLLVLNPRNAPNLYIDTPFGTLLNQTMIGTLVNNGYIVTVAFSPPDEPFFWIVAMKFADVRVCG